MTFCGHFISFLLRQTPEFPAEIFPDFFKMSLSLIYFSCFEEVPEIIFMVIKHKI